MFSQETSGALVAAAADDNMISVSDTCLSAGVAHFAATAIMTGYRRV
jgi:hypothetical protein